MKRPPRQLAAMVAALVIAIATLTFGSAVPAQAAPPNFKAPFPCGQEWTYSHHSREVRLALDFVRSDGGVTGGSPVLASAAGTATRHSQPSGAGNYIAIDHGGGWKTYYFHLQSFSVPHGAAVAQGQEIGLTGSTGNSSGPHIHYEQLFNGAGQTIKINGQSLAPYPGSYYQKYLVSDNCSGSTKGQAFLFGEEQHYAGVSVSGSLVNFSWSPSSGIVRPDWGGDMVGHPMGYVHDGLQHVFARGADDTLQHWFTSGDNPPRLDAWDTAGLVRSDPTGFTYGDQQHVFFRNPDGELEHRWYDVSERLLRSDVWAGGSFVGDPYAFVHNSQQHVFARTAEGDLKHWWWEPGQPVKTDNWGAEGVVHSGPVGFSTGAQYHVFYRTADGSLEHRWYTDSLSKVEVDNWGGDSVGRLYAFTHGAEQHLLARSAEDDLVHWSWAPGRAVSIDDWGADGVVAGDPAGLSTPGQAHVFYRTTDGTLEHRHRADTTGTIVTDNWGGNLTPPN